MHKKLSVFICQAFRVIWPFLRALRQFLFTHIYVGMQMAQSVCVCLFGKIINLAVKMFDMQAQTKPYEPF